MRIRSLVLTSVTAVALATAAHAAPTTKPQVVDPKGDSLGAQPGTDIVSVLYTTAGRGSGKTYVPRQLVVTLTLAGPVATNAGLTFEVEATTDTCDDVTFTFEPGTPYGDVVGVNGWADWGSCTTAAADGGVELITANVKGDSIVWTFSLKSTPLELGTELTDFRARVDPSNPVVPLPSSSTGTELGLIDSATGDGTWKVG